MDFVDKDENKIKDFMTQKYEKKRYYVAPTEAMSEQARKDNTPPKSEPQAKPIRSLGNIPSISMPQQQTQVYIWSLGNNPSISMPQQHTGLYMVPGGHPKY